MLVGKMIWYHWSFLIHQEKSLSMSKTPHLPRRTRCFLRHQRRVWHCARKAWRCFRILESCRWWKYEGYGGVDGSKGRQSLGVNQILMCRLWWFMFMQETLMLIWLWNCMMVRKMRNELLGQLSFRLWLRCMGYWGIILCLFECL